METLGHGSYGEVKKIQLKSTKEYRAMKIISKEDVGLQYAGALISEIDILK
jgi:serine/threonine protein kinase